MKYTRYDLKRKNGNKTFILLVLLILILAFLFGTIIFKLFLENYSSKSNLKGEPNSIKNYINNKQGKNGIANKGNEILKFVAIQGGVYQNKENAEAEKILLNTYGTPFAVSEDNKNRVFVGIYTEDEGVKIAKILNDQKIDNAKIVFSLNKNNMCDIEIAELMNANIQVLNKLSEKNVKAIQTGELKKWCLSLKKVDKGSKDIAVLNEFKDYINKMPKEISKEKACENYVYLYEILKKVAIKEK